MAKLLKLRRGTTTQHGSFTGAEGEVTVDTDKETLVVHDGSTAGGHPVAAEDMANVSSASIAGRLANDSIAVGKIAAGTLPSDVKIADANVSGNLTIESADIVDGTIVNGDVNTGAAIAGTKISPDFGSQSIVTTGNILLNGDSTGASNHRLTFGSASGGDLAIYHDGNHSTILDNGTGNLKIYTNGAGVDIQKSDGENIAKFITDGAVELYHDNSKKFETNGSGADVTGNLNVSNGVDVTGNLTVSGTVNSGATTVTGNVSVTGEIAATSHIDIPNNAIIKIGTSDDLQIYHDGNNSAINDTGNGSLYIQGSNNIYLRDYDTSENHIVMTKDGSVALYHNGTKKVETTSGGVEVTGDILGSAKIGKDAGDYITFTTDTQMDVYVNGNNEFRFEADGDFHADGDVIAQSTTIASDKRLKENIEVIPNALDKVQALNGVSFDWKKTGEKSAGVIAQEVLGVLPEAVKEVTPVGGGDSHLTVNYHALTSILIESIKELKAEVEKLKGGK